MNIKVMTPYINNRIIRIVSLMILSLVCIVAHMSAQTSYRDYIRLGNQAFRNKNYSKAETYYRKSLEKAPSLETFYNMANSIVYQGQDSIAVEYYKKALQQEASKIEHKAYIYHNMGNIFYAQGMMCMKSNNPNSQEFFVKAAELYKSALRHNPNDNETRYNLAMTQYLIKKNQNNNKDNKENKDNKDKNKDHKDKDKNKDKDKDNKDKNKDNNKDKENKQDQDKNKDKDQDKKDKNKNDEKKESDDSKNKKKQNQNQDKQDQSIDDKTMMQLLNSAQQSEKNVQMKIKKTENGHRRGLNKDW